MSDDLGEQSVQCVRCDEQIEGDIMAPECKGPMHTDCWTEWVKEQ